MAPIPGTPCPNAPWVGHGSPWPSVVGSVFLGLRWEWGGIGLVCEYMGSMVLLRRIAAKGQHPHEAHAQ